MVVWFSSEAVGRELVEVVVLGTGGGVGLHAARMAAVQARASDALMVLVPVDLMALINVPVPSGAVVPVTRVLGDLVEGRIEANPVVRNFLEI
ncbi:hypothetical protein, partial [Mycobacteroides abscessus]|uniref:hypothetical protein n=1 Tax=Mycobacteroides abscessus TaxID=36809 RepID=UPI001F2CB42D